MAEIVLRAISNRMPTVEEWRHRIDHQLVPEAQRFVAEEGAPVAKAIADLERFTGYRNAKAALEDFATGKAQLTPEKSAECSAKVAAYEAAPLSKADTDAIYACHRPGDYHDPAFPIRGRKPSLVDLHRYHRHILDVESQKRDEDKAVELAIKDKRGCHKQWDPIQVGEDGKDWGTEVVKPPSAGGGFCIVRVPGAKPEDLHYLTEPETREELDERGEPRQVTVTRHRYSFDLPREIKDELLFVGSCECKLEDLEKYIVDKSGKVIT